MNSVLQILSIVLNASAYTILICYFLPRKPVGKEAIILFGLVLGNVFIITSKNIGNAGILLLLVSISLYIAVICKNRMISIMSFVVAYLFGVVVDYILSLIWSVCVCPFSVIVSNLWYYNLYVIGYLTVIMLIGPIVSKRYHRLIERIQESRNRQMFALILSNLGICLLIFLFNIIIGEYIGYNSKIIAFNCLLLSCYFVISTIFIVNIIKANEQKMKLEKRQALFQSLQEYTAQVERMYSSLRSFKHDYSNIMLTLYGYIEAEDMGGLRQYYEKELLPLNKKMMTDTAQLNQLMNIQVIELKSLISAKLLYATELGIEIGVEVLEAITNVEMDVIDLTRVLGIFLDNSIEAAQETKNPLIRFAAIRSDEEVAFVIANTFIERNLSLTAMKNAGVSTKGENRGIGLFNAQEIITKYQNVYWDTEVKDGQFIQTLRIAAGA